MQNTTGHPVRLDGCTLHDSMNQAAIAELTLPAGGFAVFARSADPALNGGLPGVAAVFASAWAFRPAATPWRCCADADPSIPSSTAPASPSLARPAWPSIPPRRTPPPTMTGAAGAWARPCTLAPKRRPTAAPPAQPTRPAPDPT
ncbi:MAG: hypothetical protein R3F43_01835 [bacterium]